MDYGGISVGQMYPVGYVTVANAEHDCLAMLRRREHETLGQLLVRLDRAIDEAVNQDIYTDEINTPIKLHPHSMRPVVST
jgi:hypothetical protein